MNEITPFSIPYSDNKEDLLKLVDIFHTNGFAIIEDAFSGHEVAGKFIKYYKVHMHTINKIFRPKKNL